MAHLENVKRKKIKAARPLALLPRRTQAMEVDDLLKESMEKLEKLPENIKKRSMEIRELDIKVNQILREIKIKQAAYVKTLKKMNKSQKDKLYKEIDGLYQSALMISTKKTKLAQQMYDCVDEDIATVDKANQALLSKRPYEQHGDNEDAGPSSGRGRKRKRDEGKAQKNSNRKQPANASPTLEDQYLNVPSVPVVEMPVDPNEPTYCICHQVSFGEMVMCDNNACKTEWFHFQCVGLSSKPVGKWYCETCLPLMKKTKKKN